MRMSMYHAAASPDSPDMPTRLRFQPPSAALLLVVATLSLPEAAAQSTVDGRACFQAGPMPECRSFWVTESFLGVRYRERTVGVAQDPDDPGSGGAVRTFFDGDFAYGATLGWMRNTGARTAVGGVLDVSDVGVRVGPRYRRWLGSGTALDVGVGPRWEPGRIEVVELEATVGRWDLVGLTVATARDFGTGKQDFRLGIRAGRWAGLTVYGVALTGLAVFIATWDPD